MVCHSYTSLAEEDGATTLDNYGKSARRQNRRDGNERQTSRDPCDQI
jgi:hypothetical protein